MINLPNLFLCIKLHGSVSMHKYSTRQINIIMNAAFPAKVLATPDPRPREKETGAAIACF